ncbi:preprotein translocase subunit YajC [Mycobacterium sp. SM1]|uniref:preprotein translocase subunit YajC n=1 Tax=Mycobacterium sp. SM1 TaxID=2816243 RepID=UPI001BCAAF25|nr:preprotein translocase subunit YajC [Mycobacterium sp. SM1]MBS4729372.1 preprotein translocase subunit YajC [Mycobacterium sp. SM1]
MDPVVFLLLLLIVIASIFYASRRQKRAMQATINLQASLDVGDRVLTTSGLHGVITGVSDDTVDLEIAPGVVTTWMKLAIKERIEPETAETAANEATGVDVADGDTGTAEVEPET